MWTTLINFTKKVGNFAMIAFSGYEIGKKIDGPNGNQIVKETIITTENSKNLSIENIVLIVVLMVCIGIVFAAISHFVKCITKKNTNNQQSHVNQVFELQPQPAQRIEPQPAHRIV